MGGEPGLHCRQIFWGEVAGLVALRQVHAVVGVVEDADGEIAIAALLWNLSNLCFLARELLLAVTWRVSRNWWRHVREDAFCCFARGGVFHCARVVPCAASSLVT